MTPEAELVIRIRINVGEPAAMSGASHVVAAHRLDPIVGRLPVRADVRDSVPTVFGSTRHARDRRGTKRSP